MGVGTPGRRSASPSRSKRPTRDRVVHDRAGEPGSLVPADGHLPPKCAARGGPGDRQGRRIRDGIDRGRLGIIGDIRRHPTIDHAVELEASVAPAVGQGRDTVGCLASARDPSRRRRIEDDAADRRRAGTASEDEAVRGPHRDRISSRMIPASRPSSSVRASRPLRPTEPSTAAVCTWNRPRVRSGAGPGTPRAGDPW